MDFAKRKNLGDPSSNQQNFIDLKLKILCSRYWYLHLWDCHNMVFPFWRIYWNKNEGGELMFNDNVYKMVPEYLYIISPFTSFSSQFSRNHKFNSGIHVSGKNLTQTHDESYFEEKSLIHFFIHFNLGFPFNNVLPGIYKIKQTDFFKYRLDYLTNRLKFDNKNFKVTYNLKLQSFVTEIISNIGAELWKTINVDSRVLSAHRFIENNIYENLTNLKLAEMVNMAPNSFARLFKEEMNTTLHRFILKRKIAKACELFESLTETIESVSYKLGFSDRYHFSKVFKSVTGISPAAYKSGKYS